MQTQLIVEKQDLTYLSWSKIRKSSGTAGSFLKSYSELGGEKIYYKLSDYDSVNGIVGHECVNELVVDRLLTILGIEHVNYQLIHADIILNGHIEEVYLCASSNFRRKGEDKTALDEYFDAERISGESRMDFCLRHGWDKYIYQMLVVDFLVLNRDRHGANIEVLRNKRERTIRLAPLFDHGLSLLCRCHTDEEINAFDVMADRPVQSYIGTRSTKDNLKLIPSQKMPDLNPLKESDRANLLNGLEHIITQSLYDKIWEMIWKRWCYYEDFRHSR